MFPVISAVKAVHGLTYFAKLQQHHVVLDKCRCWELYDGNSYKFWYGENIVRYLREGGKNPLAEPETTDVVDRRAAGLHHQNDGLSIRNI